MKPDIHLGGARTDMVRRSEHVEANEINRQRIIVGTAAMIDARLRHIAERTAIDRATAARVLARLSSVIARPLAVGIDRSSTAIAAAPMQPPKLVRPSTTPAPLHIAMTVSPLPISNLKMVPRPVSPLRLSTITSATPIAISNLPSLAPMLRVPFASPARHSQMLCAHRCGSAITAGAVFLDEASS